MTGGGAVSAMSKLGSGSCFDAFLPRIAGVKVEETAQLEKIRGGHERILFVDDDVAVLRFAESALPRLGFKVTMSTNGEEALTRFLSSPRAFDIVITDQIMPRMSGPTCRRKLRSRPYAHPVHGFQRGNLPETLAKCGNIEMVFKPIITMTWWMPSAAPLTRCRNRPGGISLPERLARRCRAAGRLFLRFK